MINGALRYFSDLGIYSSMKLKMFWIWVTAVLGFGNILDMGIVVQWNLGHLKCFLIWVLNFNGIEDVLDPDLGITVLEPFMIWAYCSSMKLKMFWIWATTVSEFFQVGIFVVNGFEED